MCDDSHMAFANMNAILAFQQLMCVFAQKL